MERYDPQAIEQKWQAIWADAGAFTDTNAAFHEFLFRCCGNPVLLEAYNRLEVTQLMRRVLRTAQWVDEQVPHDHLKIVKAFERGNRAAARDLIVSHAQHAKETMRRAIEDHEKAEIA